MYHDQGLIPLKLHAFHEGVNVTLGLPFPRTSPDHGTAFEIAGKGIARPDSMIAAINLAVELTTTVILMSTGKIEKYVSVFNIGLQNTFVYRWNYFLRALFGLIPLAGTVFLWAAVFKERGGGLHGYDYGSMIYYYLLTILVSNLVTPTEDEWQIAADIREGQINALLTKPMSYLTYRFSIFLSGRLVYTFVTLPPIALIFIYFRDYIVLPSDPMVYVLATVSMLMAGADSILYHVQPCDDGVLDSGNLHHRVHRLFVRILPRWPDVSHRHHAACGPGRDEMAAVLLRVVLPRSPFFLGDYKAPALAQALAIQTGWLFLAWAWANYMWKRGLGHYQAVGG